MVRALFCDCILQWVPCADFSLILDSYPGRERAVHPVRDCVFLRGFPIHRHGQGGSASFVALAGRSNLHRMTPVSPAGFTPLMRASTHRQSASAARTRTPTPLALLLSEEMIGFRLCHYRRYPERGSMSSVNVRRSAARRTVNGEPSRYVRCPE